MVPLHFGETLPIQLEAAGKPSHMTCTRDTCTRVGCGLKTLNKKEVFTATAHQIAEGSENHLPT